ncbi:MAG: biopolymer transporter ExbD [Deltaproteobacteria bacterium]|nr:biopolymer transporter ExbD [Deltaproteobacteria bacterium]
MSVRAPGHVGILRRGPLSRAGLRRALARALPSLAPAGAIRRTGTPSLSMTSMIDVLVVLTVFLLLTFTSSPECGCQRDLSRLPGGTNTEEVLDAPVVHVSAHEILLDGVTVAEGEELRTLSARARRIDGLFNPLKARHETAKMLAPNRPTPTHVVLAIDGDVPSGLVKSIVMTAGGSGYPQIDFMVHKL